MPAGPSREAGRPRQRVGGEGDAAVGELPPARAASSSRPHCSSAERRSWRRHVCGSAASCAASACGGERLPRRDDPVGQADGQRLCGVDGPAGEDHVHGPAGADDAAAAGRCRRRSAARPSGGRTPRTPRSSDATRRSHHSASSSPPATACPSTAAITGLPQPHPGRSHRPITVVGEAVAAFGADGRQVGACAEHPAGAVQDGDGSVRVGVEGAEGVGERIGGGAVDGVAPRRPGEGHGGDGPVARDGDGGWFGSHAVTLPQPARPAQRGAARMAA